MLLTSCLLSGRPQHEMHAASERPASGRAKHCIYMTIAGLETDDSEVKQEMRSDEIGLDWIELAWSGLVLSGLV